MNNSSLASTWGPLAVRGIVAVLFGIAAVFWPGITLVTFVYLFSAFILASGIVGLIGGLANIYDESRSVLTKILMSILGIVEIGLGVYLLRHTAVAFTTLILLVGFMLIFRGVVELFTGIFEDEGAMHKTVMIIGGLITALAGILLFFQPASAGVAFVWIIGLYSLITGPMLIALALDIKKTGDKKIVAT